MSAAEIPDELSDHLFLEIFEPLKRLAPGSEDTTAKALAMVPDILNVSNVADMGCGNGVSTLILAERLNRAAVTAIDLHEPFLASLSQSAREKGLGNRIHAILGDMMEPPIGQASQDLIWSEGAIYNVGLREALGSWQHYLRPGGVVAFTEICWLEDAPPEEACAFWDTMCPGMTTIPANRRFLTQAGYQELGHFILPQEDWLNYYAPLNENLDDFMDRHSGEEDAERLYKAIKAEIRLYERYGKSYSYVFFVAQAAADKTAAAATAKTTA